ncbi:hypothetical protein [Akkermansia sp.]|jgi:hypothetical protein|uniref:hypothetical protein n=1 Tax=Akkermansia sp. TaxID=1872421 RepID=UPI002587B46C|nr:hypothetical protein [Akkermansia sp.]
MTTSNKCNHALEIAEDMYNAYADGKDRYKHQPMVKYADLPDDDKAGWLNVAEQALPIIGNHALGDIRDYLGVKASGASTWWKKVLLGLAYAAVGALGFSLFQGCGHSVDVTPEKTVVCKDGSCLVLEPGHISYSQAQPETDVPPIVQTIKK